MKKKIISLVLAFVMTFSMLLNNVKADPIPDLAGSLTFYKEAFDSSVTKDPRISNTYYKYVIDYNRGYAGIAYCTIAGRMHPDHGSTVSRGADITTPQLLYILEHGYTAQFGQHVMGDLGGYTKSQAYYITQVAVWLYLGKGNGGYNVDQLSSNNPLVARAISLYEASKSAAIFDSWFQIAVGGLDLHYDAANKQYISDPMHVVGNNIKTYTLSLSNAPAGSKLVKEDGSVIKNGQSFNFISNDAAAAHSTFYLVVPESSVTGDVQNINVSANGNAVKNRVYSYTSGNASLQPLAVLLPTSEAFPTSHNFKINYKRVSCPEAITTLTNKYSNRSESNSSYMSELNTLKAKYPEINTDAGVTNPKCDKPTCEEVVEYLKNKYSDRSDSNKNYTTELYNLKDRYGIYIDQGINNPSCSPAPGKPACKDKLTELLNKYPNVAERTTANTAYINDVEAIKTLGQENGWVLYTDDISNPDCVKHYKKEIIIHKVDASTNAELAGAELAIKDASGNIVAQWVTDGTPHVVADLNPGKYTLVELSAPAGYTGDGLIEFTVEGEEYSQEITLKNSKIPNTADLNFVLIITSFILFLGFGVFGLIKTSKSEI